MWTNYKKQSQSAQLETQSVCCLVWNSLIFCSRLFSTPLGPSHCKLSPSATPGKLRHLYMPKRVAQWVKVLHWDQKTSSSKPTGRSARLRDLILIKGFWWPSSWKWNKTQRFTLGQQGSPPRSCQS